MPTLIDPLFHASVICSLAEGETLFRTGDTVTDVFQVTSGTVALRRTTPDGIELTLQIAQKDDVLAEASVYSPAYHCDAIAFETSTVRSVSVANARAVLRASPELAENWGALLARSVQKARASSEIRTLKTVADRLDSWIALGGQIPKKGQYQDLAAEISVSREALYRELARRK